MTDKNNATAGGLTVDTHGGGFNNSPKVEHSASAISPTKLKLQGSQDPGSPLGADALEEWVNGLKREAFQHKEKLDGTIGNLDEKLNILLAKQEYEYLKSYNIYVKRKEQELRDLINKLNERNANSTMKDDKINNLEKTIQSIRDDQIRMEEEKVKQAKSIKQWQSRANNFEQERDFLQQQVLDAKRQNKLLKLAITRIQTQAKDAQPQPKLMAPQMPAEEAGDTFMTESAQPVHVVDHDYGDMGVKKAEPHPYGISHLQDSKLDTQAQTSYIQGQASLLTAGSGPPGAYINSMMASNMQRAQTGSPQSRYRHIPTENLKFQKFIDLIFQSKMEKTDVKREIASYVQALETNYNDSIRDLKLLLDKERNKLKKINFDKVSETSQKNELENLFVECIEEVRKDIMKRRLKNEIVNKKKFQQVDKSTEDAREFEQSLLKLAQLAKNRVKINEFTNQDRNNLLDLFVNNEKTLLKIYEILFPHRAQSHAGAGVSQQMVESSGHQIYGQNALRAISRGNPRGAGSLGHPFNTNAITMQNQNLLNHLLPYQDPAQNDLVRSTDFAQPQTHLPNIMGANKRTKQLSSNRGTAGTGSKGLLDSLGQSGAFSAQQQNRPNGPTQAWGPVDGTQNFQGEEDAYPGVQASHLGVYRHDTSVNLMKYNVNGQMVNQPTNPNLQVQAMYQQQ